MRRSSLTTPLLLVLTFLLPAQGPLPKAARAVGGGVAGMAVGLGVSLGIVVARARLANRYIESTADVLSWQALPIPLGMAGGAAVAWSSGSIAAAAAAGALGGAVAGVAVGAALGAVTGGEPEDRWAGGTMGGAAGILVGLLLFAWRAWRRRRRRRGSGSRPGPIAALLAVLLLGPAACGDPGPVPMRPAMEGELVEVAEAPSPDSGAPVEDVVLLVGDIGKANYSHYPVLPRLTEEVDFWSARIDRDSAVVTVMLGDIVYPDGMHAPDAEGFPVDSTRVADQIDIVRGPTAQRRGASLYFVAGNHDWGFREDFAGARRLNNLDQFLDRARQRGPNVRLVPPAGTGGPYVVDVGPHLRLILLDTAWWLFDADPSGKADFVEGVDRAMATAGGRHVVIAAHHPYQSAGPHGGLVPFWKTLGVRLLLVRSGAMLQDLNSRPYREMIDALEEVFARRGRPLLFAGGHEHSLQVIQHDGPGTPRFSVVSGSASKLTDVGVVPGMVFRRSEPGYMKLLVRQDGAVDLYVDAAPARYLSCPENEPDEKEWEVCMAQGVTSYRRVFSVRLAEATAEPGGDLVAGTEP